MSEMILHWSPLSPFVRKVMYVAHELHLADRIQCIRTKVSSQAPNPDLIADNPLIKIPTLVLAEGGSLFDSVVICEYLDSLGEMSDLYPERGKARWAALRWQALGDGLCDVLIAWRHERDRVREHQLQSLLESLQLKVNATLDQLERETAALTQASFGIGHIAIGCALGYTAVRFADLDWQNSRPALARWQLEFEQRDASRLTRPVLTP